MSQTQATQPEVANYITDIFGADSDDEEEPSNLPVANVPSAGLGDKDQDDIALEDSDDEAPTQRTNLLKRNSSQASARSDEDDKIEDSDEEEDVRKTKIHKKKRKDGSSESKGKDDSKHKKKKKSSSNSSSSSSSSSSATSTVQAADTERVSGDEYDSGDDVQRTAEDDRFIDEDDELADVAGEYAEEEQVFDDERPDDYGKGKGKSKSAGRGSSSEGGSRKSADPFSETLEAMKKPKAVLMSEGEKDRITERLLHRMHDAFIKDEALFKQGEPAVYKLQMLRTVQQMVAVKTLQHNLLEKDILGAFKDWIEPKRDAGKTLPSLTVRTAIYEMLAKLPCQTDHLKRTEGDKKPIGYTILALRKHKQETPENKRALKELMEKWCRPVFRKSADARSSTRDASSNAELTALAMERHAATAAANAATVAAARAASQEDEEDVDDQGVRAARNGSQGKGSGFDAALAGATAAGGKDIYMRARTPYSNGFLFTVQPDAKVIERKESNEKAFGQTRALLLKKMTNSSKGGGGGTKVNPRAMDMAMTGRNKA